MLKYGILHFINLEITAFFGAFERLDGKKSFFPEAKSDNLLFLTICYICVRTWNNDVLLKILKIKMRQPLGGEDG
jgi:hypothetical protein